MTSRPSDRRGEEPELQEHGEDVAEVAEVHDVTAAKNNVKPTVNASRMRSSTGTHTEVAGGTTP